VSPRYIRQKQPDMADNVISYVQMCLQEGTSLQAGMNFGLGRNAQRKAKAGKQLPERVRVYEKIRTGIWSYNGIFHLVDSWQEQDEYRKVFKFKLVAVEGEEDLSIRAALNPTRRRVIPTSVKLEVWKRDVGKCVMCALAVAEI
jgi:hypothetical protein